jgi:hypothetical protein
MMRVLTVWASLNTAISYRQGMHELLAPIVKVTTSSRPWTLGSESTNTVTITSTITITITITEITRYIDTQTQTDKHTHTHTHTHIHAHTLSTASSFPDSTQSSFLGGGTSQVLQRDIEALERDHSSPSDDEDGRNIADLLQVKEHTVLRAHTHFENISHSYSRGGG